MRRFFIQPPRDLTCRIDLDKEESHHIIKVLRLQPGINIELYDGTGFLYQAVITEINKTVSVQIHNKKFFQKPEPAIILHAGLLKNKKMEFVLQKATELGVDAVHLFTSSHTSTALPDAKKMNRYKKIIRESCKQCERLYPMPVYTPTPLTDQLEAIKDQNQCYLFWEKEQGNSPDSINTINKKQDIHIFTGPEGGFSEEEIESLPAGIKTISLGHQILRAETAVITGVAIVAFLSGRFKI
jgi:16S rRNA (uracil1498-N3)-methyltransferase